MNRHEKDNGKKLVNGKIKGTSSFNIQQADEVSEISWSNNNSDHAKTTNKADHNEE